jgi:DnaJ domain
MDTLYDLLGALPRDDADGLRTAFRKAVKGTHPDLRPGDPDAALKFRQIVRANDILSDVEQRAAYDHLLALAQLEKSRALAHPVAAKIHKVASGVMALTSASIVTVGGYLAYMHMPVSMALLAPSGHAASAHNSESNADLTARVSASIAAVSVAVAPDPAAMSALIAKGTPPAEAAEPAATTIASLDPRPAESESLPEPVTITLPELAPNYASPFYATRVSAQSEGDLTAADLEQAMQLSPKLLVSYVDRGVPWYQTQKSDHVFDDLTSAKPAEKPGHARVALTASSKSHAEGETPPKVVPLPKPRNPMHVHNQRRAWYASVFQ